MASLFSLPIGLLLLRVANDIAASVDPRRGPFEALPAVLFFGMACAALAFGLWAFVERLERAAQRPDSALRAFAGTGRAFLRPLLAAALLAAVFLSARGPWRDVPWAAAFLIPAAVPLLVSAYLCFDGVPSTFATWRAVGAMTIELAEPRTAPGATVRATVALRRRPPELRAALRLYESASTAKDHLAGSWDGDVSLSETSSGWSAGVSVRLPSDARRTSEDETSWRYWELEVWTEHGGRRVSRVEPVEVV